MSSQPAKDHPEHDSFLLLVSNGIWACFRSSLGLSFLSCPVPHCSHSPRCLPLCFSLATFLLCQVPHFSEPKSKTFTFTITRTEKVFIQQGKSREDTKLENPCVCCDCLSREPPAHAEGLGRWGRCESRASTCLQWAVVTLLVISQECGLSNAKFPEFSREAGNILIFRSWQLIQIFDKYGVCRTKCVCWLNLVNVLFICALCYIQWCLLRPGLVVYSRCAINICRVNITPDGEWFTAA